MGNAWPKIFTTLPPKPPKFFTQTVDITANQGMYNAFLAAGLLVGADQRHDMAACFLLFVAIAGLFGTSTVSTRILLVQTVPAEVGLFLVWQMRRQALADYTRFKNR